MAKINAILAHKPWEISADDIADLLDGDGAWSISECVQAFVILTMFHFLCGMYEGLCITPEIDQYILSIAARKELKKDKQKDDDIFGDVSDILMSPTTKDLGIESKISSLDLTQKMNAHQSGCTEMKMSELDEDDDEDEEEDEQSLMNVRKLLTVGDQHKLLPNDSCDKKGFEDSATLSLVYIVSFVVWLRRVIQYPSTCLCVRYELGYSDRVQCI